jgi:hypothetical protein
MTPTDKLAAIKAKIKADAEATVVIQELWLSLLGKPVPDKQLCHIWLSKYEVDTILLAIDQVVVCLSRKDDALQEKLDSEDREPTDDELDESRMTFLDMKKYVGATCRDMKKARSA